MLLEFGVYDTCREPFINVSKPFRILHNDSAKVKKAVTCASGSVKRFGWTCSTKRTQSQVICGLF